MAKLILLSVVIASFVVPIWNSTSERSAQALRRTQIIMFVVIIIWATLCRKWYPNLVFIE